MAMAVVSFKHNFSLKRRPTIEFATYFPAGARSAPAGPKGRKAPKGAFRPFGPVGVLRRRLLHRNGNFVPLAP